MAFVRKSNGPCQYSVRYLCDCEEGGSSSAVPLIVDADIIGHKHIISMKYYVYGAARGSRVKFCPGCGTKVPAIKDMEVLEELKDATET